MMFDEWFVELQRLAIERDLEYLLSPNPADHREGFDAGNSPDDELDELIYAARVSM